VKHEIKIEIDDADLTRYSDKYLAMAWHAAQHNPAEFGDYEACELTEHIGREIVRRWLRAVEPELWAHQGRHPSQKWLSKFATYQPGEAYNQHAAINDDDNMRAFHAGQWVRKADEEDAQASEHSS
jgi:hypothetical protein